MPLVQTRGAASAQGFGEFAQATAVNYIEDVFSTYLYTGTGAALTITNNIDLSTKGGLVWIKGRSGATGHRLTDTARGATKSLASETTAAEATETTGLTAFGTTGFTIGADADYNTSAATYVSWTFREQAKFFDVVTWTGDSDNNRMLNHSLGSVPGCIITKCTSTTSNWFTWHIASGITTSVTGFQLNTTAAATTTGYDVTTSITSTQFRPAAIFDSAYNEPNVSGRTYVAYIFAHNAGGFGLTGTDNVISCGTFTAGTGSVNLGYEPQWIMFKGLTGSNEWIMFDTMRGWPTEAPNKLLMAESSAAEGDTYVNCQPTATGFNYNFSPSCIYIAIRRGPMKVPTVGTSVFEPVAYSGTGTNNRIITSSITPDSVIPAYRNTTGAKYWYDRLRGNGTYLITSGTNAEGNDGAVYGPQFNKVQTGYQQGTSDSGFLNNGSYTYVNWLFSRAPGFFDVVCYTGTGSALTVSHNLAAVPELIIGKNRTTAGNNWPVLFNFASTTMNYGFLNLTNSCPNDTYANAGVFSATPTSTSMFLLSSGSMNTSANNHVAYLFATCAGVSKVGTYTGTGATQTINCGFTAGSRFVMIKRTDSTGDWYVWDSARGIIAGDDPYLLLNSTAAEVTNTDYIDTANSGFEISSTAPAAINANGGTFIFLAIA